MRRQCAALVVAWAVMLSGGAAPIRGVSEAILRGHECKGEGRNAFACQSQFAGPVLGQCVARRGKRCP